MRRRRRNAEELPYDEWIPAHAVAFNSDGTVDVMTEAVPGGLHIGNPVGSDRRPIINIYGERGNWTYSMELPYVGEEGWRYSHHMDLSFPTIEDAEEHALEHIGRPDYGGTYGTVENWQNPKIKVWRQGFDPAGIYALGPGVDAHKMPGREYHRRTNRRRNYEKPDLIGLINEYNDASSPSRYESDEEYEINTERARQALRAIRQYYIEGVDYRERSNGSLWPM